jgi:protein-S-isoprenylcysteine O-methyltransferase Ste14
MEDQKQYFKGTIPPPVIFFVLLIAGYAGNRIMPFNFKFPSLIVSLLIGMLILTISGAIAAAAIIVMMKNKTAINYNKPTTKFILKGPFRFTRNPLYLSLLMAMAATAFIADSLWYLVFFVIMFLIFNFGIVAREERYLTKSFGEEYIQYKNKVRRWI